MATSQKNLSSIDPADTPNARHMKFGVVVSDWNHDITHSLLLLDKPASSSPAQKKDTAIIKNLTQEP